MFNAEYTQQGAQVANSADCEFVPFFLLRVTGLPFTVVDQLQFPLTAALVEEILDLEDWQKQSSGPLLAALTAYAEQIVERDTQHKNLDLRRSIANNNGKKAYKLLQMLASHLPGALFAATADWCQKSMHLAELISSGEPTLQSELQQCRMTLRHLFSDENFQRGLLLSSPTLYTELQYYLATPPEKINNRLRRAEEGLLSYFIRAATKTSPYSTFTSTSLGVWQESGEQPVCMNIQDWQQKSSIRFHAGILDAIVRMLATRPEVRPYLCPALNSSLSEITNASYGAASPAVKVEFFIQEKNYTLPLQKRYDEHLLRVKLTPLLKEIINLIVSYNGELAYDEIVEKIVVNSRFEHNNDEKAEYNKAMVREGLEYLEKRSIIAIDLRIPEHEDDAIKLVIKKLAAIPGKWVAMVREMFQHMEALKDAYSTNMAHERAMLLKELEQHTLALCREVGSLQNPPWDGSEQVQKAFPGLLLEDTLLPFTKLSLPQTIWQPVLNDMDALQKIAALVSEEIVWKMMFDCLTKEDQQTLQFPITDVLHYHQYAQKNRHNFFKISHRWRERCPQVSHWIAARQALTSFVTNSVRQAIMQGDKTLVLDPIRLAHIAEALPPVLQQRFSFDHFGQFFIDHGEPRCVLNSTRLGPGAAFSRFSYMFEEEGLKTGNQVYKGFTDSLKQYITRLGEQHGGIYASLTETAGLNVNIHSSLAPYEILLPHNVSLHSLETQLHLRDLHIIQVPETAEAQLWSQRLQKRIFPIHMGFSIPIVQSPLYQTLTSLSPGYPSLNMVALLESDVSEEQKKRTRHYPRIAFGHIVLNRESWKLPFSCLPQRHINDTAFAYFLKVNRWRRTEGLPIEGFRRGRSRSEYQAEVQQGLLAILLNDEPPVLRQSDAPPTGIVGGEVNSTGANKKASWSTLVISDALRKPFYTHFHNYFLVNLLGSALKALPEGETLTFEELLPTRAHHLLKRNAESYTTECVIEIGRKRIVPGESV